MYLSLLNTKIHAYAYMCFKLHYRTTVALNVMLLDDKHVIICNAMIDNVTMMIVWQFLHTAVYKVATMLQIVTGYWKTDHVRTFGQLLFIGSANSHTHTLPVHCCINGLS